MISYILFFLAIYKSSNFFYKEEYDQGIKEFAKLGVIPLSLISAFKHLVLTGSIIPKQEFFEIEAGGVNLGIGISSIYAIYKNLNISNFGIIFLIYTIYLILSLFAWIFYNPKTKMFNILSFISVILVFSYYSYLALNTKAKTD